MEAENKELRARTEALEKKGGEGAQGGQDPPSRKESGMEEQWGMDMDVEDEIESRKKLDEQRPKAQDSLKNVFQQQLQEVEQRRQPHVRAPESAEKITKNTKRPGQEKICRKKVLRHKKRCAGSEDIVRNEERMADAEMAAEPQRLQAGEQKKRQQCFASG